MQTTNFDVYNSFLIRTTAYFPLEMYLKELAINCILQSKAIYRQKPKNPSMLFSKKLLKQVRTKKLSLCTKAYRFLLVIQKLDMHVGGLKSSKYTIFPYQTHFDTKDCSCKM